MLHTEISIRMNLLPGPRRCRPQRFCTARGSMGWSELETELEMDPLLVVVDVGSRIQNLLDWG